MIEIVKITAGEQKPETVNLLPCPFCGGEAYMNAYHDQEERTMKYYVTCFNSDCRVKPSGGSKTSIKEAIEDWNTRA